MRIILFRNYGSLKLYIILYIFYVLIIVSIYQTIHSNNNKFKSLPSKFRKCWYYNSEDKIVSSFSFDTYFDRQYVNVALNNSTHSVLIISRINRSHYVYEGNFTERKRDRIRCVTIPCRSTSRTQSSIEDADLLSNRQLLISVDSFP